VIKAEDPERIKILGKIPEMELRPDHVHTIPVKILIVESDRSLRNGIAQGLKGYGLEIQETGSPLEALEWLKTRTYRIIISGLDFTIMDGIQALARIKALAPETPIILLSVRKEALKFTGQFYWLEKPIRMEALLRCIGDVIGSGLMEASSLE
jgi:DNA-binding NtrC family response regulator